MDEAERMVQYRPVGISIGPRFQLRKGPYTPYVKTLVGLSYLEFPYGLGRGRYLRLRRV
jgi:hypothetical protein